MKNIKKRKSKNFAVSDNKGSGGSSYRFGVNPLIKDEILQLVKTKDKKNMKNRKAELRAWSNFEEPQDFQMGIQALAAHLGIHHGNYF